MKETNNDANTHCELSLMVRYSLLHVIKLCIVKIVDFFEKFERRHQCVIKFDKIYFLLIQNVGFDVNSMFHQLNVHW